MRIHWTSETELQVKVNTVQEVKICTAKDDQQHSRDSNDV